MKWLALLIVAATAGGCVSKSKSQLRSYQAYMAGQREAGGGTQARVVNIIGNVKNHMVNWSEDLTLTKALVAAEYQGMRDPRQIWVKRGAERYPINIKAMLAGNDDPPLEPGDIIELQ